MALGGGTFSVQNKVIPGTYINFVSAASSNEAFSERGTVTMPLILDWGKESVIMEVTNEDFKDDCMRIFGYPYTHEKMKGLRDLFRNSQRLYVYRLNTGGAKAINEFAEAVYSGVRGNDLKIIIQKNVDNEAMFDVKTMLDMTVVDEQTVESAASLVDNSYVNFKKDVALVITASTPLTGGTNGEVTGAAHQDYLDKVESCSYNVMGVTTTEEETKALYAAFAKRMREEMGVKFQVVLYRYEADYYGVINVTNKTTDENFEESAAIYWVTGASAGCEVNKSNQNKIYDGEFTIDTSMTQAELRKALKAGEYVLHKVGTDVRVLADINSMITETEGCSEVFKENQTIRVIDQIANDIAVLFNTKYLGVVPNDNAGRVSLWSDIVKHHKQLNEIRAIEEFSDSDVTVSQGENRKSVVVTDAVTIVNSMDKLYMTVTIA